MKIRWPFIFVLFSATALGQTPAQERLWDASRSGDAPAIRAAVSDGANVNGTTTYGATALAFAARNGHLDAVQTLIELGADIDARDDFYQATPVMWALSSDHDDVAIALIEAGAGELGDIIRLSAAKGKTALVEAIIKSGRASPEDLNAALDAAREAGQKEIAELLIQAGAGALTGTVDVDADTLERYVGTYEFEPGAEVPPGIEITIRRDGTQLFAQITGQAEYKIYSDSPTTFFYTIVQARLQFVVNDAGTCDKVILYQRGREIHAKRRDDTAKKGKMTLPPEALQAYAGEYAAESGDRFAVRLAEGRLVVGPPGRWPYALVPVSEDSFQIEKAPSVVLTFVRDDDQVIGYSVVQQGTTQYRHRVDVESHVAKSPAADGNWPAFRGANASGIGDGLNVPTTWNAEKGLGIAWKTPIPGLGHSSPVIWGDRVFVTTAVSSDTDVTFKPDMGGNVESISETAVHQWKVYCLEKQTGDVCWERTACEGQPKLARHPKSSQANCTPATDGEHLVVSFASQGLYCYDLNGKLLWSVDPGLLPAGWFYDEDVQWGYGSSPIIYRNLVITQCDRSKDSYIAAYDVGTGKLVWKTERDEIPSWATPTVYEGADRAELLTQAPRAIRGYNPATGKELWRLTGNSEVTVATPVVGEGLFFFTAHYPPVTPIYAVRPGATGDITLAEGATSNEFIAWSDLKNGTYLPTPIVYRGMLITLANNGVMSIYDARSGERRDRIRLGGGTAGAFTASPVAADGRVYCTAEDGDVYVLAVTGEPVVVAISPLDETCLATPAITDGMIIFRTQNHVIAAGRPAK